MTIHFVVPTGLDDPARPSGGNVYDRRVIDGLRAGGRAVEVHETDRSGLASVLGSLACDSVVLFDGLLGSTDAAVAAAAARVRLVLLVHMPPAEALPSPAVAVITTSHWTRTWLLTHHGLPGELVYVAEPGGGLDTPPQSGRELASGPSIDRASAALDHRRTGGGLDTPPRSSAALDHRALPAVVDHRNLSVVECLRGEERTPKVYRDHIPDGGHLLSVGAVIPDKGHDVLIEALGDLADLDWTCTIVGALDLDPDYVADLSELAQRKGIAGRVTFAGPLIQDRLASHYEAADLMLSASRRESYGMAVTEALAFSLPVIVTDVGGHPEAVGRAADGQIPGSLVTDPPALKAAIRRWLTDPAERERARAAASSRRTTLPKWSDTVRTIESVLDLVVVPR